MGKNSYASNRCNQNFSTPLKICDVHNKSELEPPSDLSSHLTENIIDALFRLLEMFVIARNSTYTYKDKTIKVQQVAEDLGIRLVLEGSVQKSGENLRVTVSCSML
jgi:TolB-like protein